MTKPDPTTDRSKTQAGSNGLTALAVKLPHHPVVLEEQAQRAADIQLRTASAGYPLPAYHPAAVACSAGNSPGSVCRSCSWSRSANRRW